LNGGNGEQSNHPNNLRANPLTSPSKSMAASQNRKLRVGVIGAGTFAEACHVPGLQSHPQAEIVAICGRRQSQTRALADRFSIPDVYSDYEELCARHDLDAVTIVTPNVEHARQARTALASGKHVFCEKPLAMTVEEARGMVCEAEASGKIHQVAFTYRYLYGVQELKKRMLKGDIGSPYYMRLHWECWDAMHHEYKISYRDKQEIAGGGVLYDVGSHLTDLSRFILGPLEGVMGFTEFVPRQRLDSLTGKSSAVETDDIAAAWFMNERSVRGQWFASRVTPSFGERSYIEVIGREGALRASLSRGSVDHLRVSSPTRPAWEELPLPQEAKDRLPHCLGIMMRSFVDACLRGKPDYDVDATFQDGLAVQQILAAVVESSTERAWVHL
jgi:predicted dehydrogenase